MPWPRKIPHGSQLEDSTSSFVRTTNFLHKRDFIEKAALSLINNLDILPPHERNPKDIVRKAIHIHELIEEEMRRGK